MNEYLEEVVFERTYNCQIVDRKEESYVITLRDMETSESISDKIKTYVFTEIHILLNIQLSSFDIFVIVA